ncbi:MAG TPA: beta-propeller fold lactonase family protein [Aliidongia sp.]|uniref:YncE family protein n=1 Tax=Aliidongia sp. TaxID=1914230 RepID=UPI002DDD92B5|nr:beta-propeller fold lactonase family protein [Aliidongia sp.]HEV2675287.1 beta-propeller fold lactonase family protein [Aliidongia sp.]
MSTHRRACAALFAATALLAPFAVAQAQLLVVGNDEKTVWDDAGKAIAKPPGNDTVTILDIAKPAAPATIATFKLENTVVGPPTNLAITPDEHLALVANSLHWVDDGSGGWKGVPDTKLYVIDLKANPAAQIATVEVGRQPSGLAISRKGDLCLIADRADNTVSVLSIAGTEVKLIDVVALAPPGAPNQQLSAVAITPDGTQALVVKAANNSVALLKIDGQKVTYTNYDMNVGIFPYNVQIPPGGQIGIVNVNGNGGASDGQADTVAIVDMEAKPPRVIDQVVVGDGPEGLAVSPTGKLAVSVVLNGNGNVPKTAFFHTDHAYLAVLKIDGKKVTKVGEVPVGQLAEGAAFSPDGKYLYVGNYLDADLAIFKVDGTKLIKAGPNLKTPGQHPASMRGSTP